MLRILVIFSCNSLMERILQRSCQQKTKDLREDLKKEILRKYTLTSLSLSSLFLLELHANSGFFALHRISVVVLVVTSNAMKVSLLLMLEPLNCLQRRIPEMNLKDTLLPVYAERTAVMMMIKSIIV